MNQPPPDDRSSTKVEILVREAWIDKFLTEHSPSIPIGEKYAMHRIRINIGEGTLNFQADILEKEGSTIEVTSKPVWDAEEQKIKIEDLQLQTSSKNILLKSAGWLAQNFLNTKIDKKIEEQANQVFARQLEKLRSKPLMVPIPKGGNAEVNVRDIVIHELVFIEQAVKVTATIYAFWKIDLDVKS